MKLVCLARWVLCGLCVTILSGVALLAFIVRDQHSSREGSRDSPPSTETQLLGRKDFYPGESVRKWLTVMKPAHDNSEVDLVIAIPSVTRQESQPYIISTLNSLFQQSTERERSRVLILIFLADKSSLDGIAVHKAILDETRVLGDDSVEVISVDSRAYPSFENLPRNFNDDNERVQWRAKQCLDYAIMMDHARGRGRYYMQLEDDVIAVNGFISKIFSFIESEERNKRWALLETTRLGFIGKVVHDEHLDELALFFRTFYQEQPVDYLIFQWLQLKMQPERIFHTPSLFQHIGEISSLRGKRQVAQDAFAPGDVPFAEKLRDTVGNSNPKGVLFKVVGLDTFRGYKLKHCYEGQGYFWGTSAAENATLTITLLSATEITSLLVVSGHELKPDNVIENGLVELSDGTEPLVYEPVAYFNEGLAESTLDKAKTVKRIRIRYSKAQEAWTILTRILLAKNVNTLQE